MLCLLVVCSVNLSFLEFTEVLESINLYFSLNFYSKDVLYPGRWHSRLVKCIFQPGILAVSSKGLLVLYQVGSFLLVQYIIQWNHGPGLTPAISFAAK